MHLKTFPSDPVRCKKWVKALGIEELALKSVKELSTRTYICYAHFNVKHLTWVGEEVKLAEDAVPTRKINRKPLDESLLKIFSSKHKSSNHKSSKQKYYEDDGEECQFNNLYRNDEEALKTKTNKGTNVVNNIDNVQNNKLIFKLLKQYNTEDPIICDKIQENKSKIYDELLLIKLTDALQEAIFCSLCLSTDESCLLPLDQINHYVFWSEEADLTYLQILELVFGSEIEKMLSSYFICEKCCEKAVEAFNFIHKTKTTQQVLNQYIMNMEMTLDAFENTYEDLKHQGEPVKEIAILPQTHKFIKNVKNNVINKNQSVLKRLNIEAYRIGDKKYFVCPDCGDNKTSKTSIMAHLRLHDDVYNKLKCSSCKLAHLKGGQCKYTCYDCGEAHCIHDKYMLAFVDQIEIGAKNVKCPDCDFIAVKRRNMVSHANRAHLNNYSVICEGCSQRFYSRMSLTKHINKFHTRKHACEYCNKLFKIISNKEKHERECENIRRQFGCTECKYSSDTQNELKKHYTRKHGEGHLCFVCNFKALSKESLRKHMTMSHSGITGQIRCHTCNKTIAKGKMREHMTTHPKPRVRYIERDREMFRRTTCKHCYVVLSSRTEREEHMKFHLSYRTCQRCDKQVLEGVEYRKHLRSHAFEDSGEVFSCDICDETYPTSHRLRMHQKKHNNPIHCKICNKEVKYTTFKTHMLTHKARTDNIAKQKHKGRRRRLKCPKCHHTSYTKGHLEAHVNNIHNNCKPYNCDICPRKFAAAYLLNNHLEQHLGKRFGCFVCQQKFADRSSYVRDSHEYHGDICYECPTCKERFNDAKSLTYHRNIIHDRDSPNETLENENLK